MLRQIIKPQKTDYTIRIPDEYINQKVEILILPYKEPSDAENKASKGSRAIKISKYKIKSFIDIEDSVQWQRSMREDRDFL